MVNNIIVKLPAELVNEVLSFHPYFFKFKKNILKLFLLMTFFTKIILLKNHNSTL